MHRNHSLLFDSYKFSEAELDEVKHKLADPLVRAYIKTQLADQTQITLTTFNTNDLAKTATDVAFLNGMVEIGGKLIFDDTPIKLQEG